MMNSNLRYVRKMLETAIRMLDENGWSPALGGEWRSKHVDVTVIFQKPTRYCPKASYRVIGSEIGVWVGYLHGASHKNIGKPVQVYTPEQLARELEYRRSLREER